MGSLPSPPTSTFPYQTTFLQEVIQALPLSTFLKQQIQIQNLLHLLYQIIQAFLIIYDSSDNNFNSTISSASSSSTFFIILFSLTDGSPLKHHPSLYHLLRHQHFLIKQHFSKKLSKLFHYLHSSNNKLKFKTSSICSIRLSKISHYLHSSNNKFKFKTSSICSI